MKKITLLFAFMGLMNLAVFSNCIANFFAPGDSLGTVYFNNQSTADSLTTLAYYWDFGDGGWSYDQDPIYTYSQNGVYFVCLTIEDSANNCFDTFCDSVLINDVFTTVNDSDSTSVNCSGFMVEVYDSSFAGGGVDLYSNIFGGTAPYSYLWSNGVTTFWNSNLPGGTYSLIVTDANGCTAVDYITAVNDTDSTSVNCNGLAVYILDSTSYLSAYVNGGAPGYTYLWSTGATTQHITPTPGTSYSVTVTDANNCTSVDYYTTANDTDSTSVNCSGFMVEVYDSSYGGNYGTDLYSNVLGGTAPYSYLWSDGETTSWHEGASGNYSLTVTDANGCTAVDYYTAVNDSDSTVTTPACKANFSWYADSTVADEVIISDWSTGSDLEYHWDFGDGTTSTDPTPTHTYADDGPYVVCLEVTSALDSNCNSIVCDTIYNVQRSKGFGVRVVRATTTGINDATVLKLAPSIYPNPAQSQFTVEVLADAQVETINIYSITGSFVKSVSVTSSLTVVDINDLVEGIYLVEVRTAETSSIKRVSVVR